MQNPIYKEFEVKIIAIASFCDLEQDPSRSGQMNTLKINPYYSVANTLVLYTTFSLHNLKMNIKVYVTLGPPPLCF